MHSHRQGLERNLFQTALFDDGQGRLDARIIVGRRRPDARDRVHQLLSQGPDLVSGKSAGSRTLQSAPQRRKPGSRDEQHGLRGEQRREHGVLRRGDGHIEQHESRVQGDDLAPLHLGTPTRLVGA